MTFVSFAPHSEDVLLWRALRDKPAGFYVDVGAENPDHASVTHAFYERGWTGLNLALDPAAQQRLQAARPRDICLTVSLSDSSAPTAVTLLDRHAPHQIHFLRVDAQGHEATVLEGMDFRRHRPWIVFVAAVDRATLLPSRRWDPDLRAAGYHFVWFDGLNRFYVAEEHDDTIGRHFRAPPNAFDDFRRATDSTSATGRARTEAQAEVLSARVARAEAQARAATSRLAELRLREADHTAQIEALQAALDDARSCLAEAETRTRAAALSAETIQRNASWRVTAPMRGLVRRIAGETDARIAPELSSELSSAPEPLRMPMPARTSGMASPAPQPVRTVHQVHPAPAGAAAASKMLLIRRLLQAQGYASEIFCDEIGPEAGALARPCDTLPTHGQAVLLVHASVDDAALDLQSLPATGRVLMVHDLAGRPATSLAPLRPHVAAVLAGNEHDALALQSAGFPVVRCCRLPCDIEALRATAGAPDPDARTQFTLLFAGPFAEIHALDELIAAFALFRAQYPHPTRLVLAGCGEGEADFRTEDLREQAASLGLSHDIVITEAAEPAEAYYQQADLFISLSRDSGIVPTLIEAMAHGVPVLAWPAHAVPHLVGPGADGDGVALLTGRAPQSVAAHLLDLAEDPPRRQALIRRQMRALERLRPERQMPTLLQVLALAGAAPPEELGRARHLETHLRLVLSGPIGGRDGVSATNRAMAIALEARWPGRTRAAGTDPHGDVADLPAADQARLRALAGRPGGISGPEIAISHHAALQPPRGPSDAALVMLPASAASLDLATVRRLNTHFQGVLAPSGFAARALIDSGVRRPIYRVPPAPELSAFRRIATARPAWGAGRQSRLTFLHVSDGHPRTGVDVLLAAYARAFRRGDPVRLVIKSVPSPHNTIAARLAKIRTTNPHAPEIVQIHHDLDADAFLGVYRDADVMVLPTRGEGFSLPAVEAMAAGLALIVTDFGDMSDLCDASTARLIAARLAPVPDDDTVSQTDSGTATGAIWAEPSEDELLTALLESYSAFDGNPTARVVNTRIRAAAARVADRLTPDSMARGLIAASVDCLTRPVASPARMAWISTWGPDGTIAEATRQWLDAGSTSADISEHLVLAEAGTPVSPEGAVPRIRPAWHRGELGTVDVLAGIIAREDPDILVIQHHPDLLAWGELERLLRAPSLAGRVVAVVLHETTTLASMADTARPSVIDALTGAGRVIVPHFADLKLLHALGLAENAVLVPYGVPPDGVPLAPPSRTSPRKLPATAAPVIGFYGGFRPEEGMEALISAVALLRGMWPRLTLRLAAAAEVTLEAKAEMAARTDAAREAGVGDALEWVPYTPGTEPHARLAGCDVVVLPSQTPRAASDAILREAVTAGMPIIVSPMAAFASAAPAVVTLDHADPMTIADTLRRLLREPTLRRDVMDRAQHWRAAHAWPDIAERMQGMLLGLLRAPDA